MLEGKVQKKRLKVRNGFIRTSPTPAAGYKAIEIASTPDATHADPGTNGGSNLSKSKSGKGQILGHAIQRFTMIG